MYYHIQLVMVLDVKPTINKSKTFNFKRLSSEMSTCNVFKFKGCRFDEDFALQEVCELYWETRELHWHV